jgi:ABC-type branched-subunit amino acid transport system substrate-binding protein
MKHLSGQQSALKRRSVLALGVGAALGVPLSAARAQKRYDPGASDSEIKVGQTMPYSGPASAYGKIARVAASYFKRVNDEGAGNGRQTTFRERRRRL